MNLIACESVIQAYSLIIPNQIQVIVTDQQLDTCSGPEFLETVSRDFPLIKSVLILEKSTTVDFFKVINESKPYRILTSPVNMTHLHAHIDDCLRAYIKDFENEQTVQMLTRQNQQFEFLLRQRLLS
jgi:DNA-binding NtrC family response regulator